MTIERTELAVNEYEAKMKVDMSDLGSTMARAIAEGDNETVRLIVSLMHSRQAWRNQPC